VRAPRCRARRARLERACGLDERGVDQRAQPAAELCGASHRGLAHELRACGARILALELDDTIGQIRQQPARRTRGDQAPAVEDGQLVTALGLVHEVRRDQDRDPALGEIEERLPEVAPALRIDGAGRLVEHEQLGLVQDRARQRETLALPARERARELAARLEAELCEQRGDAPTPRRAPGRGSPRSRGSRAPRGLRRARSAASCSRAGAAAPRRRAAS
jgi:hypothetical protein